MKKIAVITPVLCPSEKAFSVISKCMKSVRAAVDKVSGKYIIIDDNSKVGSGFFASISDDYRKNEITSGVSISLNRGFALATEYDFVVKLDSDYLVPENLFEILLNDWSDDLCFISPSYIMSDYEIKSNFELENLPLAEKGIYDYPPGLAPSYLNPPSKFNWGGGILMFDRKKLEKIGYFDEDFGIGGAQDNDVIYRLLLNGYNWRWDNNVVTRHFASVSSRDEESTQDWHEIRNIGVEYFKKKYGFEPGGFISKIYQRFGYKFEY